jgi:hypothetical protein
MEANAHPLHHGVQADMKAPAFLEQLEEPFKMMRQVKHLVYKTVQISIEG